MQMNVWKDSQLPSLHVLPFCLQHFICEAHLPQGGVRQDSIQIFPKLNLMQWP